MDDNQDVQYNQPTDVADTNRSIPNRSVLIGGGVVALLVVLLLVSMLSSKSLRDNSVGYPSPDAPTPSLGTAYEPERIDSANELPSSFPAELVLAADAQISEGYTLRYPEADQLSLSFTTSSQTASELHAQYLEHFMQNSWIIVNNESTGSVHTIYAIKDGQEINFTATQGEVTQVELSVTNPQT